MVLIVVILLIGGIFFPYFWARMIGQMMPAEFRPVKIKFAGEKLTPEQFDHLARQLKKLMDFRVEIGRLLFILLESLFHSWRGLAKGRSSFDRIIK